MGKARAVSPRGIITAFRTLTSIPLPGRDCDNLASAVPWFPLVGFVLGSLLFLASVVLLRCFPGFHTGIAFFLVVMSVVLTRAFHLDGLADWEEGTGITFSR